MVADRQPPRPNALDSRASNGHDARLNGHDPADWLTLAQAACELNLSISTVRRMLRDGRLRNRLVPRRGGFAYLVYVPGNVHTNGAHQCRHEAAAITNITPIPPEYARVDAATTTRREQQAEIQRLEQQVERLSHALSRALKVKQTALPPGLGAPDTDPDDPYARYRWLVRRRKWWPF